MREIRKPGALAALLLAAALPLSAQEAERDTTEAVEIEGIVVSTTRTRAGQRIEDEPIRVEVLAKEEIEEKMLMTPGDIGMMLNETSGLRVQNSSPSLGGASVRVQGLSGRYTQLLSDGLPLYGGQSGSLSMLQIPPMDLGQVEVIKGVASALYGASALGGVVNLISRRPGDERELLLNQTTLGGSDAVLWLSSEPSGRWGYTLLAGAHRQGRADVDGDRWSDVPGYRRVVARPRLFWDDGAGRSVFVTVGGTLEEREGGTRSNLVFPGVREYPQLLETRRGDAGVVARMLVGESGLLAARGSISLQRHAHRYGFARERDLHTTGFAEVTYSRESPRHAAVFGVALQRDAYRARDVEGFDYSYLVPAIFSHDELSLAGWITLALSARLESHSEYGLSLDPRLSALVRGGGWTVRASAGTGYFAPTPFTDETDAVGLARVAPPGELEAERARGGSLDVGRVLGELELNGTLFGSVVERPLEAHAMDGRYMLANADDETRTWGGELLARWNREPFHLTATYTHLRSTEGDPHGPARREVALTPRHAAGVVAMWEAEGVGRIGAELYYTGRQRLDDNPYRRQSEPYFIIGVLAERRFGRARLFVNAENLLDARQTRWDPVPLPSPSPEGRVTTDAWAPLEGRAINGGVRWEL